MDANFRCGVATESKRDKAKGKKREEKRERGGEKLFSLPAFRWASLDCALPRAGAPRKFQEQIALEEEQAKLLHTN